MPASIIVASPVTAELKTVAKPITPEWVLSGSPVSQTESLGRSRDWISNVVIWECSAGSFNWHYSQDEALVIISGEAFVTDDKGAERRLSPGDFAFFPAGSSSVWRVPELVRKIAIVRETMWMPLGFSLKVCKKLLRDAGLSAKAPLILALILFRLSHLH